MTQIHHNQYILSIIKIDSESQDDPPVTNIYRFGFHTLEDIAIRCQNTANTIIASCRIIPDGGGTSVHAKSIIANNDRLYVAAGNAVVALTLPQLDLCWHTIVDASMCFGLYFSTRHKCLIVHGECEITQLLENGKIVWQASGKDIFTGEFAINDNTIEAIDFNNERYQIDILTGVSQIIL